MDLNRQVTESLKKLGFSEQKIHYRLSPEALEAAVLRRKEGSLSDTGALAILTGKFTGRSPQDKFIVKDSVTENQVEWGGFNIPFSPARFEKLYAKMIAYLQPKEVWVRDVRAGADSTYACKLRVINELPAHNLFVSNMFLSWDNTQGEVPEWLVIQAPDFEADPIEDGTRQKNFSIIDFTKKIIIIGGSAYTGEIKKGVFTVLNFTLPIQKKVLSMHCSANKAIHSDEVSLFFGLSGTGKTTLSADTDRLLIGDDEHGWSDNGVFNFEGGCYAKCINLSAEQEPTIYKAIKKGALLENVVFKKGTNMVDYADSTITENTRVSYPLDYIENALKPSMAGIPKNIFFLTCDAFGILPPVSKLTEGEAMYHFLSGYTARVAGTEAGVKEPSPVFSYCFGAPFLPLSPLKYAAMLGERLKRYKAQVWLVNTGWSGGKYGIGSRIKLQYTRAIISAIFKGQLNNVKYEKHPVFGIAMPDSCPGVPTEILNPVHTWSDQSAYNKAANELAVLFHKNFEKYSTEADMEVLKAQPCVL